MCNKVAKALILIFGIFCILLVISVFVSLKAFNRSHELSSKEIYETFIAKPVPLKVELIKGKGIWWQGYSFDLIFLADRDTFKQILADYQALPNCLKDGVDVRRRNSLLGEEMNIVSQVSCYYKRTTVRSGGDLYLLLDNAKNKAYLYGNGG